MKRYCRIGAGYALLFFGIAVAAGTGCRSATPPPDTAKTPSSEPYRVAGKKYYPLPAAEGFSEKGMASWYGKKFHGRKTASGEVYDMYAMTAAHKTLPLGTWVDVRNLNTGDRVRVRINDRGPFVHKRIIDLSYAAAKAAGVVGPGTAPVEIRAVGLDHPSETDQNRRGAVKRYFVQVGAFRSKENAARLQKRLARQYGSAHLSPYTAPDGEYYRVRVGNCALISDAEALGGRLEKSGFSNSFVVSEP